jgi:hypothetical protein
MSAFTAEQLEQLEQLIRRVVREELDASGLEAKPKPTRPKPTRPKPRPEVYAEVLAARRRRGRDTP